MYGPAQTELHLPPERRPAFSLIEVLICCGIVLLLLGLASGAILRGRESANRVVCTNHLREIGIAFHGFDNTYRRLPPAFGLFPEPPPGVNPGNVASGSAFFHLLPFVEQQSLYESSVVAGSNGFHAYSGLRRTHLPLFVCPSDSTVDRPGLGCYMVNEALVRRFEPLKYGLNNIPDGASHTALCSESSSRHIELQADRAPPKAPRIVDQEWCADWNFYWLNSGVPDFVRGLATRPVSQCRTPHSTLPVLLADGSCVPLSPPITTDLWFKLSLPDDGVPANLR